MPTLTRLLCATDLSPASGPAVEFAQRLAAVTRAELLLLNVVPPMPVPLEGGFDPGTYERLLEEQQAYARTGLEQLAERARQRGLGVTMHLEEGLPAPRILEAAERERADLVVVGTHGRTGLNRLLVGSVAEHVVQVSTRPVITVRPQLAGAAGPERPFGRILYPTDFSPAARRAWPWVRVLAERTDAQVEVLHVLLEVVPDHHLDPAFLAQAAARIRQDAEESMERFLADSGLPRARVRTQLGQGVEADAIVRAASAGAELIVMGTHGRTGFLQLALGSVTRRVLHDAPCPVLTVGPKVE
jgi:nucleotide-binding universal stress UspA family protein